MAICFLHLSLNTTVLGWYIRCVTLAQTLSLTWQISIKIFRIDILCLHGRATCMSASLRWRHNERDSVSNHQPHDCLLSRLFRRRSKKTSKLCVTGLCVGNSPGTGEFPAQLASYAENVSIWWRHHVFGVPHSLILVLCLSSQCVMPLCAVECRYNAANISWYISAMKTAERKSEFETRAIVRIWVKLCSVIKASHCTSQLCIKPWLSWTSKWWQV